MEQPSSESREKSGEVRVRPAYKEDLPGIRNLMAAYEMVGEFRAEECVVAEIENCLCGFARVEVVGEQPYLRPIVVAPDAHGRGVGKALLHTILEEQTSLIAISRGSAVGFYERLGFVPVDWDRIHSPFRTECLDCPDLEDCQPQPMGVALA